jgi:hypothetical protein
MEFRFRLSRRFLCFRVRPSCLQIEPSNGTLGRHERDLLVDGRRRVLLVADVLAPGDLAAFLVDLCIAM